MPPGAPIVIGSNRVFLEEDIIFWMTGDEVTAADAQRGHELFDHNRAQYGYVCLLGDIRQLRTLSSEMRRLHTDWHRLHSPYFSVALFGGSTLARTLVRLLFSAAQLFVRGNKTTFAFFNTEPEAREWLKAESVRLAELSSALLHR